MTDLSAAGLDLLFREARTRNGWQDRPVPESLLRDVYEIACMGPTSANGQPMRTVFVTTAETKARLAPAIGVGNRARFLAAPVTAVFAYDLKFYDQLPKVFPHNPDARSWFAGDAAHAETTAFRNATLQAAYFMLAARAKGLDCGPMSGFDAAAINTALFPDGQWKANFLCGLGYGTDENLFPRSPRLSFEDACRIV
jgi:3-hydroxypropanoate dehydrogenase